MVRFRRDVRREARAMGLLDITFEPTGKDHYRVAATYCDRPLPFVSIAGSPSDINALQATRRKLCKAIRELEDGR